MTDGVATATTTATHGSQQGQVVYFSLEKFDLTQYKTLTFHLKTSSGAHGYVGFYSNNSSYGYGTNLVTGHFYTGAVDTDVTLDVSNLGSGMYFGIGLAGYYGDVSGTITATVSDVKLE